MVLIRDRVLPQAGEQVLTDRTGTCRDVRIIADLAGDLPTEEETRLWSEALFRGPIRFEISVDTGLVCCRLCRALFDMGAKACLYEPERTQLVEHCRYHMAKVPPAQRAAIFSLIQLGHDWPQACKEILGVSPMERDEWIRFWRINP